MKFSAFARYGNGYRFSSRKPRGQLLFEQIRDSHGGVYGDEGSFSGPVVARWFALAMTIARAQATLERAKNQAEPLKLWDLLKAKETHYGLAPAATATLADRRQAVAAAEQLSLGPKRGNVEYQLRSLLGADFVAWVTADSTSANNAFPQNPETLGIFNSPALWKTVSIDASVNVRNVSLTRHWTHVDGDDSSLLVGDILLVAPGELGQQEAVTVTARTSSTFTATYTRSHEAGTVAIRRPWPFWCSNMKHSCVVVKHGRAADQALRQKAEALLHKLLGATSSWDIVEENAVAGTAGPFLPGTGLPGLTPIPALSY